MHAYSKSYSSSSWIKRIRTWAKAQTESEMAKLAGCKLGEYSTKKCTEPGVYNVRYSGTRMRLFVLHPLVCSGISIASA